MENNYRRDIVEIDLLDLMLETLKHWKLMIAVGIVCAIIGGATGAIKEYMNYGVVKAEAQEEYDNKYSAYEAALQMRNEKIDAYNSLFDTIDTLTKMKERRKEYLDRSVYLNLDPYKVAENTVLWKVTADQDVKEFYKDSNIDPADEMLSAYVLAGNRAINYEEIGKEMNMDPGTIPDLISIYSDNGANQVCLKVFYKDEAGADTISKMVREQIKGVWEKTGTELQGHEIEEKPAVSRMTAVSQIENDRKIHTDAINVYDDKISVLRTKIDTVKNPYEIEEPEEPEDNVPNNPAKSVLKNAVKYGTVGLIVGFFLVCAVFGCRYLFSGTIHTASELTDYFGLEVLADLTCKKPSRDELVRRCAYLAEGKSDGSYMLVSGTAPGEELAEVFEDLEKYIRNKEIKNGKNFLINSSVLADVDDTTDVILVEKRNVSKRNDISDEIRCIRDRKGRILGAVIV